MISKPPQERLNVLVVEDEPNDVLLTRRMLELCFGAGAVNVTTASTVEAALTMPLIEQDVILLDLSLPDVQGRATFHRIHAQAPLTPIVLVTGNDDESFAEDLVRSGAQDYLVKSHFDARQLCRAIRYAIERQKLRLQVDRLRDDLAVAEVAIADVNAQMPIAEYTWTRSGDDIVLQSFNPAAATWAVGGVLPHAGMTGTEFFSEGSAAGRAIQRAFMTGESVHLRAALPGCSGEASITCAFLPPATVTVFIERPNTVLPGEPRVAGRGALAADETYRALIEAAPVGITIADATGDIEHANSTLAAMLGYSVDELTALSLHDLIFPSDRAADPLRFDIVLERGSLRRERTLRTKSGSALPVEISAIRIDGSRFLAAARDLSALRKSEEEKDFQANLLAHVQDAVIATDTTGRVTYWNGRAEQLYLWTRAEAIGRRIVELITPPEMLNLSRRAIRAVFATGHWEGQFVAMRKDGMRVPVFVSFSALTNAAGKRSGAVSVSFDRTEVKKAEEARAQNEMLLNSVLDNLPVGVWIIDGSGMIVRANPEAKRIWGGAVYEPVTVDNSYKARWAESGERMTLATRPAYVTLTTGKPVIGAELEIEAFDGVRRRVIMSSLPVLTPSGESLGVVVVNLDVTELRFAEQKIRDNEIHFKSLIEHSSDIINILSPSGEILYVSPSVEGILGYRPDELVGRSVFDFLRPDFVEKARVQLANQMASEDELRIDVDFRHKNGTWRSFDVITSRYKAGTMPQIIANSRDVTERNLLTRGLEQANRVAGLGRLAASIAHEINNILMGIQPFAEIIRRNAAGHLDLERASDQITRSIQRGKRVTEEILNFAKPAEPHFASIRVADLFASLGPELQTLVAQAAVLEIERPPHDFWIRADRDQICQVLTNLVLNSRDAQADRITLRAERAVQKIQISIVDDGIGMHSDVVDRIFEPLFTTKSRGTGLGLSVVRQIVTRHDGTIDVATQRGRGSTFSVALPEAPPRTEVPPDRAQAPLGTIGIRRILLVEDDPAVAAGIAALLELDGFEVSTVSRGGEAEAEVERFRPDALVLDYGLPDISGADVYALVSKRWPQMPAVFSTGQGEAADVKRFLDRPHIGFLLKPYEFPALLAELRRVAQS